MQGAPSGRYHDLDTHAWPSVLPCRPVRTTSPFPMVRITRIRQLHLLPCALVSVAFVALVDASGSHYQDMPGAFLETEHGEGTTC
jgi:hypothetical protein